MLSHSERETAFIARQAGVKVQVPIRVIANDFPHRTENGVRLGITFEVEESTVEDWDGRSFEPLQSFFTSVSQ